MKVIKSKTIVLDESSLSMGRNGLTQAMDDGYEIVSAVAFPVAVSASGQSYSSKEAQGKIAYVLTKTRYRGE